MVEVVGDDPGEGHPERRVEAGAYPFARFIMSEGRT
jgi:hypothetical protein